MEDKMEIKIRRYADFRNEIVDTLNGYSNIKNLILVRTGVTIDDDEIFAVATQSANLVSFRVNRDSVIVDAHVNPLAFSQPYYNISSVFEAKDKQTITDYINSFKGMKLEYMPVASYRKEKK